MKSLTTKLIVGICLMATSLSAQTSTYDPYDGVAEGLAAGMLMMSLAGILFSLWMLGLFVFGFIRLGEIRDNTLQTKRLLQQLRNRQLGLDPYAGFDKWETARLQQFYLEHTPKDAADSAVRSSATVDSR